MKQSIKFTLLSLVFLSSLLAQSIALSQQVPGSFVYQGQIVRSGVPLQANPVFFTVLILDPQKNCLLYREYHSVNMQGSDGVFQLNVGNGMRTGTNYEDTSVVASVFQNGATFSGLNGCTTGTSYTSQAYDTRKVRISYNDGTSTTTLSQDFHIQTVPYAWYANSLQGLTANNFLQVNVGQNVTQANLESLLGGSNYNTLYNLATGSPTAALSMNGQQIKNVANPTSAQDVVTKNYADTKVAGFTIDTSLIGSGVGDGKVLSWDATNSKWVATTPSSLTDTTKLPLSGGTMSGNINMGGNQMLNTGHITMASLSTITIGQYTAAQESTLVSGLTAANKGAVWFNTTTGKMMYWDGSGLQSVGGGTITGVTAGVGLTGGGASGAISLDIATGGITTSLLADSSVTTAKIVDGTIATVDLADSSITSAKIADGGVATVDLADGSVTDVKINTVSANKVVAAMGQYLTYTPNGVSCNSGEVLKWNTLTGWECGIDNNSVPVSSVFGRTGAVVAAVGDYVASQITNTPAGTLTSIDAQSAINELDTKKVSKSGDTMTGTLNLPTDGLAVGTSQLVVSGGNVGIGTASPAATLQVKSANPYVEISSTAVANDYSSNVTTAVANGTLFALTDNFNSAGGDNKFVGIQMSSMSAAGYNQGSYIGAVSVTSGTTPSTVFGVRSGATKIERMRIHYNGYVGIGTNSPSYPFHVSTSGNAAIVGERTDANDLLKPTLVGRRSRSDSTAPGANFGSQILSLLEGFTDNSSVIATSINSFWENAQTDDTTSRNSAMSFSTMAANSAVERLRITSSGNVGIGTTTPAVSLDMGSKTDALRLPNGTTAQQPSSPSAGMLRYNTTTSAMEYYNGSGWLSITNTGTSSQTFSGDVVMSGAGTGLAVTNNQTVGGTLSVTGATTLTGGITSGGNITGTGAMTVAAGGTNQNLTLSGSGTGGVVLTPNVGIGTSSPTVALDVVGSTKLGGILTVYNSTAAIFGDSGSNFVLRRNVDDNRLILAGGNSASSGGGVSFYGGSHSTSPNIITFSNGATEAMRLNASGNFGIGTSSPTQRLHVNDSTAGGSPTTVVTSDTGNGSITAYSSTYAIANIAGTTAIGSSGTIDLRTGNTTDAVRVYLGGSSNTGYQHAKITFPNTTTGSLLTLGRYDGTGSAVGNGTIQAASAGAGNTDKSGAILYLAGGQSTGAGAGGSVVFQTSAATASSSTLNALTERMRITSAGSVGIGTSNPGTSRTQIYSDGSTNDKVLQVTGSGIAGGQAGPFYGIYVDAPANNSSTARYGLYAYGNGGGSGSNYGVYGTTQMGSSTRLAVGVQGDVVVNSAAVNNAPSMTTPVAGVMATASTSGTSMSAVTTALIAKNQTIYGATSYGAYIDAVAGPTTVIPLAVASNGVEKFRIDSAGSVGIGTTSPGYKLDVQGGDINASGSVRAAGVALTSDVRYKRDIQVLDNALDKILSIHGVSYNWRADEFPEKHFNSRHQVGVIAQEVEAQFPEVVDTNSDGYKSVNYPALVAPLIEAVKALYQRLVAVEATQSQQTREIATVKSQKADRALVDAKVHELEAQNAQLKQENSEMKARLDKIEKMLNSK